MQLRETSPVWLAVGAVILDRAITLPFWGFEANPVVAALGRPAWVGLSAVLIVFVLFAWFGLNAKDSRAGHGLAWCIAGFHGLAIISNVAVVLL